MPTVAYCLAASALFEDVEHARTYFERHALAAPLAEEDPTDLLSLIRWANGRGVMVARHLGKSEDQTVSYLATHLDALLKSLRESPEETALRDFSANGDLRASCKRHGVSPNVGLYLLRILALEKMGLAQGA